MIPTAKALGRVLARRYGWTGNSQRECACNGLTEICIDCPHWWELFLTEYDSQAVEALFEVAWAGRRFKEAETRSFCGRDKARKENH